MTHRYQDVNGIHVLTVEDMTRLTQTLQRGPLTVMEARNLCDSHEALRIDRDNWRSLAERRKIRQENPTNG